jgi:hypothetical protein
VTLVPVAAAQAKTITVTSRQDSGSGTLRAAITEADNDANDTSPAKADLITFASGLSGSIDLQSPLPTVTDSIDLHGPGARRITINGKSVPTDSGSLLYDKTAGTDLTVVGLSFVDAIQKSGSFIFVKGTDLDPASLKLVGDSFTHGASSDSGGAVYSDSATLTVEDCVFAHNSTAFFGGAVWAGQGEIKFEDSTLADNSAGDGGGAISGYHPQETFIATTITGNSVSYSGADEYGYGGGIDAYRGKLVLEDSIVAGNTATGNPAIAFPEYGSRWDDIFAYGGTKLTARFSLIQRDTKGLKGLNSTDITGKSPDLGPLRNNGGSTDTEMPKLTSPVINAGRAFGLKTDQRGLKRTVKYPGRKLRRGGDGTDIGAVELQRPKKHK